VALPGGCVACINGAFGRKTRPDGKRFTPHDRAIRVRLSFFDSTGSARPRFRHAVRLMQSNDAIIALRIRPNHVEHLHRPVGRGDRAAQIAPVGLMQITLELHLKLLARNCRPGQGEDACG
jgi:hypothetical protein